MMWPRMPHAPMRPCDILLGSPAPPQRTILLVHGSTTRRRGGKAHESARRPSHWPAPSPTEECDYLAAFSRFTITIAPARSLQQDPSGSPSRSMLPGRVPHGHRHGQLSADQTHTNRPKAAKVTLWGSSPALSPVIFRPHITLHLDWCRKQKQIFLKLHRASRVASIGGAGLQGSFLIWAPSLSALEFILHLVLGLNPVSFCLRRIQ
jgi:hypothetical protein